MSAELIKQECKSCGASEFENINGIEYKCKYCGSLYFKINNKLENTDCEFLSEMSFHNTQPEAHGFISNTIEENITQIFKTAYDI